MVRRARLRDAPWPRMSASDSFPADGHPAVLDNALRVERNQPSTSGWHTQFPSNEIAHMATFVRSHVAHGAHTLLALRWFARVGRPPGLGGRRQPAR